jgi:hypothetical protein
MAITYVGAGASANTTTGATLTVGLPAGIAAGDFMLIAVGTVDRLVTTPPGWILLGSNLIYTNNRQLGWLFYKIAALGESSASVASSPSGTGANAYVDAKLYAWRGGTQIAAPLAWAGLSTVADIPTPALTTLSANALLVFFGFSESSSLWTPPAGVTKRDQTAINIYIFVASDQSIPLPGLVASANFTATPSANPNIIAGFGFAAAPAAQPSQRAPIGLFVAALARARNAERKQARRGEKPSGKRVRLDYLHKRGRPS